MVISPESGSECRLNSEQLLSLKSSIHSSSTFAFYSGQAIVQALLVSWHYSQMKIVSCIFLCVCVCVYWDEGGFGQLIHTYMHTHGNLINHVVHGVKSLNNENWQIKVIRNVGG